MNYETLKLICLFTVLLLAACGKPADVSSATSGTPAPVPPKVELAPMTNMILVKAGTLVPGQPAAVVARDFWLGRYEVTQWEYSDVMGKNPSNFQGDTNRPVEKVTWLEAVAYCNALTSREQKVGRLPPDYQLRLPSGAEWEYACQAGATNLFSFGDDADAAPQYAWTAENSDETTHPVGQKLPNAWGFHDMHGNVWEWTMDWFVPAPGRPNAPGSATNKFKVFRGGGWNQDAKLASAKNQFMMSPSNGIHFVGFRVALSSMAQ